MNRRKLLEQIALASGSLIINIGTHGWAAKSIFAAGNKKRLIFVFLRGAADGLNIVIPHFENSYYDYRTLIEIPPPNEQEGALNLDGKFGLHPALESIFPLWQQKTLAFVHCCGSPDSTRSHFDAQNYIESGTPGKKNMKEGWMNRLLGIIPGSAPTKGVSLTATTPLILAGKTPISNLSGKNIEKPLLIDNPNLNTAFDRLYNGNDSLSKIYQQGRAARQQILADFNQEMIKANNGANPVSRFAGDAQRLAKLMVSDSNIEIAFLALGGWDTHINQGGVKGSLANSLKSLGEGLNLLVKGLGNVYNETAIIVMSEFGRTVRENGNGGTDHGHGNVMWFLGGKIKGGKVYGQWTGLGEKQLYQGRDLEISTDFRDAIASILIPHLQLDNKKISTIFPNYAPKIKINLL